MPSRSRKTLNKLENSSESIMYMIMEAFTQALNPTHDWLVMENVHMTCSNRESNYDLCFFNDQENDIQWIMAFDTTNSAFAYCSPFGVEK